MLRRVKVMHSLRRLRGLIADIGTQVRACLATDFSMAELVFISKFMIQRDVLERQLIDIPAVNAGHEWGGHLMLFQEEEGEDEGYESSE